MRPFSLPHAWPLCAGLAGGAGDGLRQRHAALHSVGRSTPPPPAWPQTSTLVCDPARAAGRHAARTHARGTHTRTETRTTLGIGLRQHPFPVAALAKGGFHSVCSASWEWASSRDKLLCYPGLGGGADCGGLCKLPRAAVSLRRQSIAADRSVDTCLCPVGLVGTLGGLVLCKRPAGRRAFQNGQRGT